MMGVSFASCCSRDASFAVADAGGILGIGQEHSFCSTRCLRGGVFRPLDGNICKYILLMNVNVFWIQIA